jgi:DNA polymerase-3 subunit gamma/tau
MSRQALALKYRPKTFNDLTEQESIKRILTTQINTNTIKNGYLFTGPAGCGKTTSARIFADMINNHKGIPIELDAASNNSVDDIRSICEQAQTRSLDSEYKVFILDEVHVLSNQAWQAMLKTLEEPPTKSIFILCTTNPEKIPQTILSRVQRYNFQKIGLDGIVNRLLAILEAESDDFCEEHGNEFFSEEEYMMDGGYDWDINAIHLIAKLANGGMRDAITLMDKCLSYSHNLTEKNVISALGVADYSIMFRLNDSIFDKTMVKCLDIIDEVYNAGIDLKQFMKTYFEFIIDIRKYGLTKSFNNIKIPTTYRDTLNNYGDYETDVVAKLSGELLDINHKIKWEKDCKSYIEARFLIFMEDIK